MTALRLLSKALLVTMISCLSRNVVRSRALRMFSGSTGSGPFWPPGKGGKGGKGVAGVAGIRGGAGGAGAAGAVGSVDVESVRSLMLSLGLDALLVPAEDPHMSEYAAPYFGRREFISGFTGSAGMVIITQESSLLFTDGRYHKQAEMELSPSWTLMKQGLKDVPTPTEYLATLPKGAVVGIDPLVHAATALKMIQKRLTEKGIETKTLTSHPVDQVWGDRRPPKPAGLLREHPLIYAGKSVTTKMAEMRAKMAEKGAVALVACALDEIAYLFNFRSSDVACNPISVSYAVLTPDAGYLFIDQNKVPPHMQKTLLDAGVKLLPYEDVLGFIKETEQKGKIWFDGKSANFAVFSAVSETNILDSESPITIAKAVKNDAELEGMRACHLRDGAAVVEFFAHLDEHLASGNTITEVEIDEWVTSKRASYDLFVERSFPTIAGANDNAAIMHYRAMPDTCRTVGSNDLLLLDSGGQWVDGTTDVTRTFHTGTPPTHIVDMFTYVFKGNIALDELVFPTGTAGCLLDSHARQFLWKHGKNFLHGVGHGVGAALNVHEGPHRISPMLDPHPLKAGNVVSNEPGFYENGNFGIRIENLLEVVDKPELGEFEGKGFLGFKKLTHIPFQKKMINVALMTDAELLWLNTYHAEVATRVGPLLQSERARVWLRDATAPLTRTVAAAVPGAGVGAGVGAGAGAKAEGRTVAAVVEAVGVGEVVKNKSFYF